ncbi:MAG: response regulator [Acidobacteria bacterium]|nr:response regulator [Acidobacteriota bacterium]MBI3658325.1 response regulator [Acidobacteriota bacterium]
MKRTLLLVDDREMFLHIAKSCLVPKGFNVLLGHNEEDVMKELARAAVDMVLLDIGLGLKGDEGLGILRRIRESTKDLPIIMVSADAGKQKLCYDLGATAFIPKPVNYDFLYRQIYRALTNNTIIIADDKPS